MKPREEQISSAEIHTPEELLGNAEFLISLDSPKTTRAAILESIAALESYVYTTVFVALENKIDPLLVNWLKDKTKMDFDSRLSVLTPIATGFPVSIQSDLWNDYKKAKKIRNKVSHSGTRVSTNEARFVIDTVYSWLAYLGSTVELEASLVGLKEHIEQNNIKVENGRSAVRIIEAYFKQTKAVEAYAEYQIELGKIPRRADLIMKFGPHLVLVETKFSSAGYSHSRLQQAVDQVSSMMIDPSFIHGAVVIFQKGEAIPGIDAIQKHEQGKVLSVVIYI